MFWQNAWGLRWVDQGCHTRHLRRLGEAGWWFWLDGSPPCARWGKPWLVGGGGGHARESQAPLVQNQGAGSYSASHGFHVGWPQTSLRSTTFFIPLEEGDLLLTSFLILTMFGDSVLFLVFIFIYLAVGSLSCGVWNHSSPTRDRTQASCLGSGES